MRIDTGGMLAPDEAFLLRRGLETLPLRVRRQCAQRPCCSPPRWPGTRPSRSVDYPGLPSTGHEPRGGCSTRPRARGSARSSRSRRTAAARRAWRSPTGCGSRSVATSLGGTHTLVSHVASTTHRQLDDRGARRGGHRRRRGAVLHRARGRRGPDPRRDQCLDTRPAATGAGGAFVRTRGRPPGDPAWPECRVWSGADLRR